jgi:uncharacterized protein with ParB-like and HNH nuclease domain/predicted transport protein
VRATLGGYGAVGRDKSGRLHFLGSIVYIAASGNTADFTRWLVIDGQQRLTTLTLLLLALREKLKAGAGANAGGELPKAEAIDERFLRNRHVPETRRHKLVLRRTDHEALSALLEGKALGRKAAQNIRTNYEYFCERVEAEDLSVAYAGFARLVIVQVCLTQGHDDPQMIFESLNSTGLDLTQADLIRNFVLMRHSEERQTELYNEYWQPIEQAFGARYRSDFDKFARDYLTLQLEPSSQLKADEIYSHFRTFFFGQVPKRPVEELLADLRRFAGYYVAFSLGRERNSKLAEPFKRLRQLVEVASPVVLKLYDCHERLRSLSVAEFTEAAELLESYVFRRSVCDMQTRSLGQIFASLAYRIQETSPLTSLKVALARQSKNRRFPQDAELRVALETRDVYDMRSCHYLLDRLENDSKERIDTSEFSIEHVLPQNEDLRKEWREMLGKDWKQIQEEWLHRLGNITLTAYNPEYSDRSFKDKKAMKKGFDESPLRLNKSMREAKVWTVKEIKARGQALAAKALKIWPPLVVDKSLVRAAELVDMKARASRYSAETLAMEPTVRKVFDALRPKIVDLGPDVVELFGEKSVVYRVFDFFLEVLPRKQYLTLLLNLDFEECDVPHGELWDTTKNSFVTNATEEGGVGFDLGELKDIPSAMYYVKLAYSKVSD